jgi:hyperosmotically inducible periplasmic protein
MKNSVHIEAIVLAVVLAVATAASGAQRSIPSDQQMQTAVTQQLQDHHLRRGDNPTVMVSDGAVTLAGQVQSLWEKNEAIRIARKVDGVQRLISDLTIARAESDKAIAEAIGKRVLQYERYTIFDDVNVGVRNGVVTFFGAVTVPFKADELVDAASRVQGVQDVKNAFKALPLSPSDDRLRSELANRIFSNDNLSVYGRGANPTIHIIVDNGRVTLKGNVDSAFDKQQAEFIARQTNGVLGVDNQLRASR